MCKVMYRNLLKSIAGVWSGSHRGHRRRNSWACFRESESQGVQDVCELPKSRGRQACSRQQEAPRERTRSLPAAEQVSPQRARFLRAGLASATVHRTPGQDTRTVLQTAVCAHSSEKGVCPDRTLGSSSSKSSCHSSSLLTSKKKVPGHQTHTRYLHIWRESCTCSVPS